MSVMHDLCIRCLSPSMHSSDAVDGVILRRGRSNIHCINVTMPSNYIVYQDDLLQWNESQLPSAVSELIPEHGRCCSTDDAPSANNRQDGIVALGRH